MIRRLESIRSTKIKLWSYLDVFLSPFSPQSIFNISCLQVKSVRWKVSGFCTNRTPNGSVSVSIGSMYIVNIPFKFPNTISVNNRSPIMIKSSASHLEQQRNQNNTKNQKYPKNSTSSWTPPAGFFSRWRSTEIPSSFSSFSASSPDWEVLWNRWDLTLLD